MALTLTCNFATSEDTPEHARIAEQLGYQRAWFYDSPALYPDIWVQMCRAAERTSKISLATGVLVPHLRHPMCNAAAIATLVQTAGEQRVVIGIGSGFTARVSMGQRPLTWRFVADYIVTLKALLRGEDVEWEGATLRMLHWKGWGARRPIRVPFIVAAAGPKGIAVAKEHADGVVGVEPIAGFDWSVAVVLGTVLDGGESPGSARAIDAAGHAAAFLLHYWLEHRMLDQIPGGLEWKKIYDAIPESKRHLAMHDGHLCGVNDRDRPFITGDLLARNGLALSRDAWRERLHQLEAKGATEVAYQPAGPDIPRELEAFAEMARG